MYSVLRPPRPPPSPSTHARLAARQDRDSLARRALLLRELRVLAAESLRLVGEVVAEIDHLVALLVQERAAASIAVDAVAIRCTASRANPACRASASRRPDRGARQSSAMLRVAVALEDLERVRLRRRVRDRGSGRDAPTSSPGTSEITNVITRAGCAAAASRPPLSFDKCLRTQLISRMSAPCSNQEIRGRALLLERDRRQRRRRERRAAARDRQIRYSSASRAADAASSSSRAPAARLDASGDGCPASTISMPPLRLAGLERPCP